MLWRYLQFWLRSGNAHGLHSPFVYELYTQVLRPQGVYYAFAEVERLRKELSCSPETLLVHDLGTGRSRPRQIRELVQRSAKPASLGQLLFRLVNRFGPPVVFDLGTSLGLTTAYLAAADRRQQVISFEGCPITAERAQSHFDRLQLANIRVITGNLDETLAPQAKAVPQIDFAFFDANHRREPTLRYFETLLPKAHAGSVFVFDDIYWSADMAKAWEEIKKHPKVNLTIDLFWLGLVFFRTDAPKQHFRLRV